MICPNDNAGMQQVKAESHYGQTVMLDQCPQCGGLWFDDFELYLAKQGEADRIEALDLDNLRSSSLIEGPEMLCPRDKTRLIHFTDPFFPKEIIIARCPACNGFWLNRGEFKKYQQYRQSLKQAEMTPTQSENLEQNLRRILAEHESGDTTDVLGRLGSFLSTPVDSVSGRPLEPNQLSEKENGALNLIMNVLPLILRFFIRL